VVYAVYGRKEGDLIKSPELGHQKCPRKASKISRAADIKISLRVS